jgi:hypothetical protein
MRPWFAVDIRLRKDYWKSLVSAADGVTFE